MLSPSMAALLPPCGHLPNPNQCALCVCVSSLFSVSRMAPSLPISPSPPPSFSLCAWCTPPPTNTTRLLLLLLLSLPRSLFVTDTAVMRRCMACGPSLQRLVRPRPHTQPSQDHSGTLGAEEFKACLISLGFDIANDAQVPERGHAPVARGLTAVSFFCTSLPSSPSQSFIVHSLSLIPPALKLCSPSRHVIFFLLFATSTLRMVAARPSSLSLFSRARPTPLSSRLHSPRLSPSSWSHRWPCRRD